MARPSCSRTAPAKTSSSSRRTPTGFFRLLESVPEFAALTTTFIPTAPQVFADVDRDKVLKQGVDLGSVYQTLQAFMGGVFVNYFNRFGRVWQVYVQAEGEFRTEADNVGLFRVRNNDGDPVPLSTVVTMKTTSGPEFTLRFNGYRAAQINGSLAPGYSSGQGRQALEEVFAQTMPREMGFDYSGMSFQEQAADKGVSAATIFGFSLLFVFLILAALLRELVAAVRDSVDGSDRGTRRVQRFMAAPFSFRCLLASRSDCAHRAGGEERDTDRRIREDRVREGTKSDRRGAGRNEDTPSGNIHDIARVHSRMRAVVDRFGRGELSGAKYWAP